MPETGSLSVLDLLGTGVLKTEVERAFIEWCIVNTVRPAFGHALSTHEMPNEGRLMMTADSAQKVSMLAKRFGESARQMMFRQLAVWIARAVESDNTRTAWDNAREAAVWSLIYSQRIQNVAQQAEQYQEFDQRIRKTHAARLREMLG